MIYFPMTANILTAGHIKCIEWLSKKDSVMIGLLTAKALKGYKREIVPYEDRFYIMLQIAKSFDNVYVIPQDSLEPKNAAHCDAIASGDGWEPVELEMIKRYNIKRIDIKLKGEKSKRYSSTAILRSAK